MMQNPMMESVQENVIDERDVSSISANDDDERDSAVNEGD